MNNRKYKITFTCAFLALLFSGVLAYGQQANRHRSSVTLEHGSKRLGKRTDPMMGVWRNYGLGQFIHWGLYAIPGGHWDGKYYSGAAEWIRSWNEMPKNAYDELYKVFDPKAYDPKAWAKQAKDMGAKYMIITTKHHDGFCLWPSQYTDYSVAKSPYNKDIIGPMVEAYDAEGIDVYLYFSVMDWNHPGYRSKLETKEDEEAYEGFKEFTRNQLLELLAFYPSTKGLWFDGTWDQAWIQQAAFADELEEEMRSVIPGLIIGSRFRADENGKRHFDTNGDLMGDYEQGWERKMPNRIEDVNGNDWDCVMTVPENQWGYHSDWKGHVKSSVELIEMMVKAASLDGNFVINFGPDGQGNIRPEESLIAKEVGEWMESNAEAVYDCGYLDWEKQDWGYYTRNRKTGNVNLVVFNYPASGKLRVKVPKGIKIQGIDLIGTNGGTIDLEEIHRDEYFLGLPKGTDHTKPVVLVMKIVEGDAEVQGVYEKAKI
ncbi:alpha-L-fucosidase [Belliella marina]|uniref:alpha-L-fucosidase n=1 Tax=Belliella marina TaxID=1644146 RepID=A0ABW4VS70_9BACT